MSSAAPKEPTLKPQSAVVWFYLQGKQRMGPVSEDVLRQSLGTALPLTTLVWRRGLGEWTAALQLPEFRAIRGQADSLVSAAQLPVDVSQHPECHDCGAELRLGEIVDRGRRQVCPECYYSFGAQRRLAAAYDVAAYTVIVIVLAYLMVRFGGPSGRFLDDFKAGGLGLFITLLPVFLFKDAMVGYSFGKSLTDLRVLDDKRQPIGPWRSLKRNLPLAFPPLIAVACVQASQARRIGDTWAETMVVRDLPGGMRVRQGTRALSLGQARAHGRKRNFLALVIGVLFPAYVVLTFAGVQPISRVLRFLGGLTG